jgi:hypothetical protein
MLIAALMALTACAGPTTVDAGPQQGQYAVAMRMDPLTLNPPQLGTLSFSVTDTKTGKPVTAFEPVFGALMQNVVLSKDLLNFKHGFTDRLLQNEASIGTYFPKTGTYYIYTLYKPAGADVQVYTSTITSGQPSEEPELIEDASSPKNSGSVRVQLASAPSPIKAGQPEQLVFHLSERGRLIIDVAPFLGSPGHLWIVDQHGGNFAHESGAAEGHILVAAPSPSPSETFEAGGTTPSTSVPGGENISSLVGPPSPAPTFAPGIANALATITAISVPTLVPAQQTAQLSVVQTPAVQPAVGYGPEIAFTHTFPSAGMYKMWLEFQYRERVVQVDFVIRVEQ